MVRVPAWPAEYDMIKHFDLEQLTGADQVASDFDVGLGRSGVATGMIVGQNDRRGSGRNGALKNFARMDQERVERALRNRFPPDQAAAGVEQHDLKVLHLVKAILVAEQVGKAFGSI